VASKRFFAVILDYCSIFSNVEVEDGCDVEKYTELTMKSVEILLEPLGYIFEKPRTKRQSKSGVHNVTEQNLFFGF